MILVHFSIVPVAVLRVASDSQTARQKKVACKHTKEPVSLAQKLIEKKSQCVNKTEKPPNISKTSNQQQHGNHQTPELCGSLNCNVSPPPPPPHITRPQPTTYLWGM
jgi:hypothetical protein